MPSSYTPSLRLVLPVTGELQGAWGDTVNTGLTNLVDAAIAGTADIAMTDANRTLSVNNELPDEARCMFINLTGTLTVSRDVICPAVSKLYFVHNATNQVVVFKTSAGTGVSIPVGSRIALYCNATNVVPAVDDLPAASKVAGIEIVTVSGTQTLTNKTINLTSNTLVATSAQIAAAVTDETGTGALVFANSPTLVTPALGTPASGVVTNLTGTASININGTVGATTASTGAFTTLSATGVTTVQAGTAAAPAITTTGDTNTGIFFPAADTIAFTEGGVERMRIDNAGNVGIGTTSPSRLFQVTDGSPIVLIRANTNNANSDIFFGDSDVEVEGYIRYDHTINSMRFATNGATERMRITSAGNVGIGTSSPVTQLTTIGQIVGGTTGFGSGMVGFTGLGSYNSSSAVEDIDALYLRKGGTNDSSVGISFGNAGGDSYLVGARIKHVRSGSNSNGHLVFETKSDGSANTTVERMRITDAGNVGIGTSSPAEKLSVAGAIRVHTASSAGFALDAKGGLFDFVPAANNVRVGYVPGTSGVNTGILSFLSGNGAEAARIDSSGNVGIGTSSVFDANTRLELSKSGNCQQFISSTDGVRMVFSAFGSTSGVLGTFSNHPLVFKANDTERMRITSAGNVGIGTSSPTCSLLVEGSSTEDNIGSLQARNNNTAADACVASFVTATNSTATSNVLIKFGINNYASASGQINANGAGAAAFGGFSDRRLKKNIQELPAQLDNIMALRPVEFDYIESEGGGHQIGFIAQEMQEVYPDAVGERAPDGMLTVTGWDKTTARLVAAIQEQQAIINDLKARLDAANL
jgi:hypothetical protein